jgi:hypothetical protein
MSKSGYFKWRAQAAKRMHEFDVLHPHKATEEEDKIEKWDWFMVKHPGEDEEELGLVDIKFGGVRDDHVQYYKKHGKSHGVTHYAFGYANKATNKVFRVRVMTVDYFMRNSKRFVNRTSGEPFWLPK